eukprot:1201643-Rhodomonas_salina.1
MVRGCYLVVFGPRHLKRALLRMAYEVRPRVLLLVPPDSMPVYQYRATHTPVLHTSVLAIAYHRTRHQYHRTRPQYRASHSTRIDRTSNLDSCSLACCILEVGDIGDVGFRISGMRGFMWYWDPPTLMSVPAQL